MVADVRGLDQVGVKKGKDPPRAPGDDRLRDLWIPIGASRSPATRRRRVSVFEPHFVAARAVETAVRRAGTAAPLELTAQRSAGPVKPDARVVGRDADFLGHV